MLLPKKSREKPLACFATYCWHATEHSLAKPRNLHRLLQHLWSKQFKTMPDYWNIPQIILTTGCSKFSFEHPVMTLLLFLQRFLSKSCKIVNQNENANWCLYRLFEKIPYHICSYVYIIDHIYTIWLSMSSLSLIF